MCFRRPCHLEIRSWKEDSSAAVDDMTLAFTPIELLWGSGFQTWDGGGQGRSCGPWQHEASSDHDKEIKKWIS